MTFLKLNLLAVSLIALSPTLALATTVNLVYEGGTASGTAVITASPTPAPIGTTVGAFGFNMDDTTGQLGDEDGDFVA